VSDLRELRTPRLHLRPLTPDDIPAIARYRDDPEVARHQSWDRYTEDDARALVEQLAGRTPGTPGQWFQWGITRASDGLLLGDCGLKIDGEEPRLGQIGYTLGRAHQRQGHATEAVRAVLDLAFDRLHLHRVSASVDADNLPSLALLERLGLRREAHFKLSQWFKGAWVDDVIYAVLASEWRAHQPAESPSPPMGRPADRPWTPAIS
jgi:aminoglycoside 6'-N-acetyltransferase